MLVLSRFPGEEIVIGDDIIVSVERIQGNKVRLGIDAPPEMKILRRELVGASVRQLQHASASPDPVCTLTQCEVLPAPAS